MFRNRVQLVLIFLVVLAVLPGCRSIKNYPEPNEPLFWGNYAETPPDFEGELKVVTWNIKFSNRIEQTISELETVEELQGADILLLQEMDEVGVESIARALKYNYIYFPASIHTYHGKNFGNAILARWPLSAPTKLALPYANPKNKQTRIATRAYVVVGEKRVLVYSTHTETYYLSGRKRTEQIGALAGNIGEDEAYVLVGGDFNTFSPLGLGALERRLEQVRLTRVSAGSGATFTYGPLKFTVDHIFARGMTASAVGAWSETEASDHFPTWVDLTVSQPTQ